MVLSQLAETMRVPSAEYEAENTRLEWPSSIDKHAPVIASQMRTVLSKLAEMMRVPSEEYDAENTQ